MIRMTFLSISWTMAVSGLVAKEITGTNREGQQPLEEISFSLLPSILFLGWLLSRKFLVLTWIFPNFSRLKRDTSATKYRYHHGKYFPSCQWHLKRTSGSDLLSWKHDENEDITTATKTHSAVWYGFHFGICKWCISLDLYVWELFWGFKNLFSGII